MLEAGLEGNIPTLEAPHKQPSTISNYEKLEKKRRSLHLANRATLAKTLLLRGNARRNSCQPSFIFGKHKSGTIRDVRVVVARFSSQTTKKNPPLKERENEIIGKYWL
jgi:hypothetical protein